jgi:hypothetical protein
LIPGLSEPATAGDWKLVNVAARRKIPIRRREKVRRLRVVRDLSLLPSPKNGANPGSDENFSWKSPVFFMASTPSPQIYKESTKRKIVTGSITKQFGS